MDWTVMKKDAICHLSVLCKVAAALFFLFAPAAGAEVLTLQHPGCVYEKADVFSKVIKSVPPGRYEVVSPAKRSFSVRHPIAFYNDFYELKEGGFISPQMSVDQAGTPYALPTHSMWQNTVISLLLATLLVLAAVLIKGKISGTIPGGSAGEGVLYAAAAVLTRQLLVLCEISFWGNALPSAADEPGYFQCMYDILHGSFKGPWHFTVGLGVFYLPFILLTGAETYYDIAVCFSYFNALVIAPGALFVLYYVLKNFKFSGSCAFTVVMIWAVYPFFIYHSEVWNTLSFAPAAALPCFLAGAADWWRFYAVCINAGFNAMSDMPGLFAVLCTILLAQKLPCTCRNLFFIGMAYGFCCLVRINYIFFAPLIAFICFDKKCPRSAKEFFAFAGAAAGGFLAVFGWQLLVNFYQFGNPAVFGYSLHYPDFPPEKRPDTGFNWHTLAELRNIRFLVGANKFLMSAGIAGLLFIRERHTRIALALATLPLLLFFFGYTHTYCDARRFIMILFPLFPAAFCAAFTQNLSTGNKRLLLLLFGTAGILFAAPAEISAICCCLLLLRAVFDLQQKLFRGIL